MWNLIYNITIMPIQLLVEFLFSCFYDVFNDLGISIIFVSIIIQMLVYPLYKKADDMQQMEHDKQKQMEHWVRHIKKTFKGDERFMMLQAYYRMQDYSPVSALRGSMSLLLQIPFFMAAYNFLSKLDMLKGEGFLFVKDLGRPDAMFMAAGFTINVLPIAMTLINIVSGAIYTKGFPLKDKLQLYIMAVLFLVLLYNSPSGLVIYWTMNNLFSLWKNLYTKTYNGNPIVRDISLIFLGMIIFVYSKYWSFAYISLGICFVPFIGTIFRNEIAKLKEKLGGRRWKMFSKKSLAINKKTIGSGLLLLAVVYGIFIPMTVIGSSPTEFISTNYGPFELLLNVFCVFAGIFLLWFRLIYYMLKDKAKIIFSFVIFIMAATSIVSIFGFGNGMGVVNSALVYDAGIVIKNTTLYISIFAFAITILWAYILHDRLPNALKKLYQVAVLTMVILSVTKIIPAKKELDKYEPPKKDINTEYEKILPLSKDGKNVVVIMLDRAIGAYVPYAISEKPELKELFDGFTFYPNTLAYGGHTNFGAPALFGGYEYTPTAMNERSSESLKNKHNEALLVMPKLFAAADYSVTITDPPYANYSWNTDLSLYNKYEDMNAYITQGVYSGELADTYSHYYEKNQKRSFVYYSIMKASPLFMQSAIYDDGNYYNTEISVVSEAFISWYSVLENLSNITDIKNDAENNFILMQNSSTHDTVYFNAPKYDEISEFSYYADGLSLPEGTEGVAGISLERVSYVTHFETNVASLLRIGEWLTYLKENDVYDNTKIIIVSDHGKNLGQFDSLILDDGMDIQEFNPLLLYKDFNAKGFTISDEFMTNADTPVLAMDGVIENPINPFTDHPINDDAKDMPQYVTTSKKYSPITNNGTTFDTSDGSWYEISDDIFDHLKWKKVEE